MTTEEVYLVLCQIFFLGFYIGSSCVLLGYIILTAVMEKLSKMLKEKGRL